MKLQIKYNFTDLNTALAIAHETKEFADILEIGQLLILKEGVKAIDVFCKTFPDKKIYVDTKLSERPEETIALLAGLGVHYISVLAGAYHTIIRKTCEAAAKERIHVVIDFINASTLGQSAMEAQTLGAAAVLIHRENALNEQANNLENDWQQVRDNTDLPIFMQGKINAQSLKAIIPLRPQFIIVGDAITRSKHPAHEAEVMKKILADATRVGPWT
jgi:3-keto-L-gulonate-6-phosphate decarboxylase